MRFEGVIFDLDGVLLSTDRLHYEAWKKMAEAEGIYFDFAINERLRGVSRMASLEIILEGARRTYSEREKAALAEYKNGLYRASLESLTPADLFPGALDFLRHLLSLGLKLAIGSSSRNTKTILQRVGLADLFRGAVSDGTNISRSKPDPEVFLKAAEMIAVPPKYCLVFEDAWAGIEAARAANMTAVGIGTAARHPYARFGAPSIAALLEEQSGQYAELFRILEASAPAARAGEAPAEQP
ncbi:MAG: beta-phosphoglucomutase [Deltaproteobacteria bacterium]|nr:beta-phosphoglucomutase [Deltaproteobacteria bacterium]